MSDPNSQLPLTTEQKLINEARTIAAKFSTEYGVLRRFIVAHPLTAFFSSIAVSTAIILIIIWFAF